jgi:hypothetical protein
MMEPKDMSLRIECGLGLDSFTLEYQLIELQCEDATLDLIVHYRPTQFIPSLTAFRFQ